MPEQTTLQTTLTEMLNMAEERLDSGDYVRVANALKAASKDCEVVSSTSIDKKTINNHIKFNTYDAYTVNLVIMYKETTYMPGTIPNVTKIIYKLNNIQHTDEEEEFLDKLINIMNCVGMLDIERNWFIKTSYHNMKEFRDHARRGHNDADVDYNDDDDFMPNDSYMMQLFTGTS